MENLSKCFQTLGLEANSSPEEVKKAYRDLVQVWHPDRFSHDERLRLIAQEKLKEINGAYELLEAAFFESSIAPESAQPTEAEPTPSDANLGEEAPPSAGKRIAMWVALNILALAVIGGVMFIVLEKGRHKEMGRSPEPRLVQTADDTIATNQSAPIVTNAQPVGGFEAVPPATVPSRSILSLDGNKSRVEIATKASLTGTFTVECWVMITNLNYIKTATRDQTIVGSRAPMDFGFSLKFGGNKIHADIGNGSVWLTRQADAPFQYAKNTWYHIACVVTPRYYAIYIDGTLASSRPFSFGTPVLFDADHQLWIGAIRIRSGMPPSQVPSHITRRDPLFGTRAYPYDFLDGLIAELRIWQTARTQLQIRANMNRRLTGSEPGLRGYWPFD